MTGIIKKIAQINFGLLSPENIRKMSVTKIVTPDTYDEDGYPIEAGLMDPRLGVIDPGLRCRSCGSKGGDCQGHFGHINLARPVIHVGFADTIHKILRSTCRNCGRILLTDREILDYKEKIDNFLRNEENITNVLKEIYNLARKDDCPHCHQSETVRDNSEKLMEKFEDLVKEIEGSGLKVDSKIVEQIEKSFETLQTVLEEQLTSSLRIRELESQYDISMDKTNLLQVLDTIKNKKDEGLSTIDGRNLKKKAMANYVEIVDELLKLLDSEIHDFQNKMDSQTLKTVEKFLEEINTVFDKIDEKNQVKLGTFHKYLNEYEKTLKKFLETLKKFEDAKIELLVKAEATRRTEDDIIRHIAELEFEGSDEEVTHIKDLTENLVKEIEKSREKEIKEDIKIDKPVSLVEGNYKLTPSEVRDWLEKIPEDDYFLVGINPEIAKPEWMVLTVLPVPPVTVRPSITLETGERSEDDLTHKLVDILRINQRLKENMEAGAPQLIVEDLWELLQYHVTTYFDNEASGVPPARHRSGRPLKTLAQRLKGKEGRFRSNLSGKRVNFSARTVISPDPNISINEVGVPEMIAIEVTVPVYVTEWNIEQMKKHIENGSKIHPGANYVIRPDERKIRVYDVTKESILEKLEPGYVVERHLMDGDIVLFNRQPSLHRMSMMAHEVKVLPHKTFRLNLCVCPPYNADFDGDEMNMHVFQTEESRAEAKSLMRVQEHILSPRFGGPIIGGIHDHISGGYLLTRAGSVFKEEDVFQMVKKSQLPMPEPKNRDWTGKEIFSLLLPDDLNMVYKAEICRKCDECLREECKNDAYVVIEKGELMMGAIDEKAFGAFSGKILDSVVKEYGTDHARQFLDSATKLAISGIMKRGFTTSTADEEIPREAKDRIEELLNNAEKRVEQLIEAYHNEELEALPGRSLRETLEMKIMQVLGEARDKSGEIAESYFGMDNHAVIMALTGARGSMLNLTQIAACVGQQSVRGGRIERGYRNRTLPHFQEGELGAKASGFVQSSYKSGLDPLEFFFHAMGGREGLVDTAIRTAQSGYMQRRLVNALQDLNVNEDGTVRDNRGVVIQTRYGEDGIDPAKSDFGKVADIDRIIEEMRIKAKADK